MKRFLYCAFLMSLLFTSCVREYTPDANEAQDKLVIKAEIDAASRYPVIQIGSSFSQGAAPSEIKNSMEVAIYENGDTRPKPFELVGDNGQLWRSEDPIVFNPGVLYFLNIDGTPFGFLPVLSETAVPYPGEFELIESRYDSSRMRVDLSVNLEKPPGNKLYYHLNAFMINDEGSRVYADITPDNAFVNAIHTLESKTGILIDHRLLPIDNYLTLTVFFDSNHAFTSFSNDNLYLELKTITEDYYLYYMSLDKHLETIQNPFSFPEITFSNITNGYGLFTAYNTSLDSLRVN